MNLKNIFNPLEKRITKEPYYDTRSFFRALSIISPVLIYYIISSYMTYTAAYLIKEIPIFKSMTSYSKEIATFLRSLAVIIAVLPLITSFIHEYPLIFPKRAKKTAGTVKVIILAISSAIFFNVLFSMLLITQSSEAYAKVQDNQFSLPLWLGLIIYGVITPVTEEIVHRGIVYNRLRRYFNLPMAMIFGPLLFGLSHGNMVQLLYGFIMGVLISYSYEKYGAFLYPVLFHCVANMIVYTISSSDTLSTTVYNATGLIISGLVMILMYCLIAGEKVIDTNN